MPGAGVLRELLLQLGDLGAHDELAVIEHALDALVDRLAKGSVLGLEVDEGNHSFKCSVDSGQWTVTVGSGQWAVGNFER